MVKLHRWWWSLKVDYYLTKRKRLDKKNQKLILTLSKLDQEHVDIIVKEAREF